MHQELHTGVLLYLSHPPNSNYILLLARTQGLLIVSAELPLIDELQRQALGHLRLLEPQQNELPKLRELRGVQDAELQG